MGPSSPRVPTAASFSSHSPPLPEGPISPLAALSPSSVQSRLLQTQQLRVIAVKCRCHLSPDFRPSSPPEPQRLLVVCGLEPQPLDCPWRPRQQAALGASPVPIAVLVTLWLLPRRPPPIPRIHTSLWPQPCEICPARPVPWHGTLALTDTCVGVSLEGSLSVFLEPRFSLLRAPYPKLLRWRWVCKAGENPKYCPPSTSIRCSCGGILGPGLNPLAAAAR